MQRQHGQGRPEALHPDSAEAYFDQTSQTYAASASLQATQLALTASCLDLLLLLPPVLVITPQLMLDVGCGCGFSSAKALRELQQRYASNGKALVLGFDLSFEMLRSGNDGSGGVEAASTSNDCSGKSGSCCNRVGNGVLLCADMARMPFRAGALFDAVISVSALQWLASHDELLNFFVNLRRSCAADARAVLQFYPSGTAHAALTVRSASEAGWVRARLLCCFPVGNARKWFCCVGPTHEPSGSTLTVADAMSGEAMAGRLCPLAWPYAGTCALCWGWGGEERSCRPPDRLSPDDSNGTWSEALIEQHLRLGSQLLRLWRRLQNGLSTRLSVCERALLDAGIGESLAATLATHAQPLDGTAAEFKKKLRSVWWTGAADAMHPMRDAWVSDPGQDSARTTTSTDAQIEAQFRGSLCL